ncbi:hypothetical protein [Longirhabdus pacifica]|uniref:hypothetical protein n=1 Tax=Longirhabdus pacifica TaxID=2305227 RepID=UPI0010086D0A|nr:hypothetical protein [Longirhabdus pacifica]
MEIKLNIAIGDEPAKDHFITIADEKLIDLTEDELHQAIEIVIRDWMDKHMQVMWEVTKDIDKDEYIDE